MPPDKTTTRLAELIGEIEAQPSEQAWNQLLAEVENHPEAYDEDNLRYLIACAEPASKMRADDPGKAIALSIAHLIRFHESDDELRGSALDALQTLLQHWMVEVKYAAIDALKLIGTDDAIEILQQLREGEGEIASEAGEALKSLP